MARAAMPALLGTLTAVVGIWGFRQGSPGPSFQLLAHRRSGAALRGLRSTSEPVRAAAPAGTSDASEAYRPGALTLGALAGALSLLLRQGFRHRAPGGTQVTMHARGVNDIDDPYDRSKPNGFFGSQKMRQEYKQWNNWYAHGVQVRVRVSQWTGRPLLFPMCFEEGDLVQIMGGKERGKVATVMRVFPKWNKVILKGCNMKNKNIRPRRPNEVGRRVKVEVAMDASRIMLYSEKFKVASNVGYKFVEQDGALVKQRYLKKTGEQVVKRRVEDVDEESEEEEEDKNILEKAADLLPGSSES